MPDVVIEEVHGPLGDEWSSMTFSTYRHLLPRLGTPPPLDLHEPEPIACRAMIDDQPAGLLLAQFPASDTSSADVLSMFVAPAFRNQGIATRLLECLEEGARTTGRVREIAAVYMTGKPSIPALERVFAKRAFTSPTRRTVVVRFTPEEGSRCEWYKKARLPPGSTIFPWTELSTEERQRLQQSQADRPWIPQELEPWRFEDQLDRVSSVGLRKNGDVVGWVINHRIGPNMVRFTASFVRSDLARRGAIFPLYVAALQRLDAGTICTFVTAAQFESMIRFVLRRCAPFIGFTGETRGVTKELRAFSSRDASP